ncbi:MAG: hypothetical protein LBC79_00195 [Deltaproteobacteria bacterium]|jgi:hypothetical protein|nr:hypothetical protein [Deltaproteobacteria bacterium]
MISAKPLLFMPFLHQEFRPAALPPSLLHLWPGLPDPREGFHVPDAFPLTPQDAARYVEYMRDIGIAAADNLPAHSLLAAAKQAQRPDMLKEALDMCAFARGEEAEPSATHYLREAGLAAQKALLRIWLLEERCLEIRQLEQRCRTLAGDFSAVLGVELEEDEKDALLLTSHMQVLDDSAGPAVPWRFVVENAALFLPERSTLLFADSAICLELLENSMHYTNIQAELYLFGQAPSARAPKRAEAPLWQALGMRGARPERPWLAKVFSFLVWDGAQ